MEPTTEDYRFRLLCVNDVYSMDLLAALRRTIIAYKAQPTFTKFLMAGDCLGGFPAAIQTHGKCMIDLMNFLGVDVCCLGNHEFDFGAEEVVKRVAESNFPWLGSNVMRTSDGKLFDGVVDTMMWEIPRVPSSEKKKVKKNKNKSASGSSKGKNINASASGSRNLFNTEKEKGEGKEKEKEGKNSGGFLNSITSALGLKKEVKEEVKEEEQGQEEGQEEGVDGEESSGTGSSDDEEAKKKREIRRKLRKEKAERRAKETLKVGIFGVCTPMTPTLSKPGPTVRFDEYLPVAERCVADLKARGAQVIIALTHLSIAQDKLLAAKVPEIDMVIGGHDHTPYALTEGGALVFKCGQNAEWLGVIDAAVWTPEGGGPARVSLSWSMLANRNEPDEETQALLAKYNKKEPSVPLCRLAEAELITLTRIMRAKGGNMGNVVADAMRCYYNADMGFINGGFVRGDMEYPIGYTLEKSDVLLEIPFTRLAVLVEITGEDLAHALDEQFAAYPAESGSFPHVSRGFEVLFDGKGTPKQRLLKFTRDGKDVDPAQKFTVATTAFVREGGDGCSSWLKATQISKPEQELVVNEIVMRYLATGGVSCALGELTNSSTHLKPAIPPKLARTVSARVLPGPALPEFPVPDETRIIIQNAQN